jgi:sec-independent protein translocase protein TatC
VENRIRTVLDELEKARTGLAVYVVIVGVLSAACFVFAEPALHVLVRLLGRKLVAYSPAEGFLAMVSLSLYGGVTLSLPIGAWMLWRGAVSRWVPGWKAWGGPVVAASTLLFAAGVLLGYHVLLPSGIGFLVGFESERIGAMISARRFISFCGMMLLALGLAFQAPLISFFLARQGWLTPLLFRKRWRHAILICTILSAVITPTPDVWNMTLMALPLLGLYFVSYGVVAIVDATRRTKASR